MAKTWATKCCSGTYKNNYQLCCGIKAKYVYGLYSGKNFKENGLETLAGTIIYVFDWNGEAIKKYELNVPVTLISVDNKDEMLYAFSNMPDPELIRFKIK
ncbi:hypothetical protein F3B51_26380 [Bacteroides ovatus]|uniref:Uncharacterized protein n=1 Tax=Bacteroides ovatus TaxID=28116 RepID=A0A5M5MTH2_BACOV|nr:hypothetical protein F3C56_26550 [Bacteroides ovatus]KAA4558543.1 hypothetical protein F3B68_25365 [Bacteroides ovatus]KAA4561651.1 hypothetical protein F3B65_26620 [Bacteroides ovatus]KAA4572413.1 hypothetical protein F3B64_26440 [Bacteroides ovatus]KAA4573426.1 hypothetical protein F3C21_26625 [Bacteroides ovatus]